MLRSSARYNPHQNARAPAKHIHVMYPVGQCASKKGDGVVIALAMSSRYFSARCSARRLPKLAVRTMQDKVRASLRRVRVSTVDRLGRIAAQRDVIRLPSLRSQATRPRIQSAMTTVREEAIKTVSESRTTLLTSRVRGRPHHLLK